MVVYTGKTVEEAIQKGLQELQLLRQKAHIKVISKEKKGFLGFGKKLAQVDIEGINERTVYKADKKAVSGVPDEINRQNAPVVNPSKPVQKEAVEVEEEVVEEKISESAVSEEPTKEQSFEEFVAQEFTEDTISKDIEKASADVTDYVKKIIYEMDIEASLETSYNRRQINIQVETQEAGRVIGYHGKVLKSLQLLAQNFLHDHYSKNFAVNLNVHDYVEHRTETLIDFTQKVANRVLESEEDYTMDPMSNSERKIVHKTISTIEGVTSYSEGNDPNRYVVVSLEN
ncbi:protein jag [Streptococcus parauberis]|uniref:RNA-binding cell elongation regulator Jag/EloR n=1 Tax=Streptococcus parauberis TaxID=1348 RepID=UPI0008FA3B78|nr:RNA-binding cell elongation regulator Jag/EloR [Streptococcus parauberis]OHY31022.1 protein jag [Streptococcus parauberis]ONH64410.1 R3H domain protein [Streptococcus parauberis]PCH12071.1 R3H domain protein [Streptococcus parauberis]